MKNLMQYLIVICVAAGVVNACAETSPAGNPYAGVWYFVHGEYKLADGQVLKASSNELVAIKTISDTHFAVVNMGLGTYKGYLSGGFEAIPSGYIESITEGTGKEHIGNTYRFTGRIEIKEEAGVKVEYLHHKGMVNGTAETELWRRIQ